MVAFEPSSNTLVTEHRKLCEGGDIGHIPYSSIIPVMPKVLLH